jgi:prepilin-type N-terminal cleavage/methylation domain-containing protein
MSPVVLRGRRRDAGFTLVEILVATSLLVIGMSGVLALFSTALALEAEAEERTDVALALPEAIREIEQALGASAYGVAPAGPAAAGVKKGALKGEFPLRGAGGVYVCRWSVEGSPGSLDVRASFVKVEIVVGAGSDDEKIYDFGRIPASPEPPEPGPSSGANR